MNTLSFTRTPLSTCIIDGCFESCSVNDLGLVALWCVSHLPTGTGLDMYDVSQADEYFHSPAALPGDHPLRGGEQVAGPAPRCRECRRPCMKKSPVPLNGRTNRWNVLCELHNARKLINHRRILTDRQARLACRDCAVELKKRAGRRCDVCQRRLYGHISVYRTKNRLYDEGRLPVE